MNKLTSTLIAAAAALAVSGGAYAQNNTLATPSVVSPAAATSGYGTPTATRTAAQPPARRVQTRKAPRPIAQRRLLTFPEATTRWQPRA
jgi:hypothetical protein